MRPNTMRLKTMRLWLTPGMGVKRHVALAVVGTLLLVVAVVAGALWALAGNRQALSQPIENVLVSDLWQGFGGWLALVGALFGVTLAVIAIGRLNRSLLSNWMAQPRDAAMVLHKRLSLAKGPHIVAIGGGTGLSTLLRGLRHATSNLTAVVTVSDDGGSSGRLRTAFDMPAPGDLTDCLAALSDNELEVSRLLQYRFQRCDELAGHTFGNLFITTLTEVEGDFGKAIRVLNSLLNLTGAVYPVSPEPIALTVVKTGGERVMGESKVRTVGGAVAHAMIEPADPEVTPEVVGSLLSAQVVVLGPGSLFTSTLPPLLVPGVQQALLQTSARLVYICNIMTETGETDGFSVFDHVQVLFTALGRYPDVVVVNSTPVDAARVERYAEEGATVVACDLAQLEGLGIEVVSLPLLSDGPHAQHDAAALAQWLVQPARFRVAPIPKTKVAAA
ncbi:YvcK family protein [soil metagenome]